MTRRQRWGWIALAIAAAVVLLLLARTVAGA